MPNVENTLDALSPLDAGFLEAEDSDRNVNLSIAFLAIAEGPPPTQAEFADAVESRLAGVARAHQTVHMVALDLGAPTWVDDPGFDLGHHIRRTALPAPGDDAAMGQLVSRVMAQRLDRDRPLWECWVIEGLADGRWALLSKMHHCMADGVSGAKLFTALCDEAVGSESPGRPSSSDSQSGLLDTVLLLARELRSPVQLLRQVIVVGRGVFALANDLLMSGTDSSLIGAIGGQRRYGVARASLDDVRAVGAAFDVTVNDVVLAAITAAMRRLLILRGEIPTAELLRTLVPVSVRGTDAKDVMDNRVSLMLPYLPVDIADPVDRLLTVHKRLNRLKSGGQTEAGHAATALAERWPFAPIAWAVRIAARLPQRSIVAVTTNVPGPKTPLHILGRRILEIQPYVPIALNMRTGIAILSYADRLTFGITADYDTVPDIDEISNGIESAVAELVEAATQLADNSTTQRRNT